MSKSSVFRSKVLAVSLVAAFVLLTVPVREFAASAPKAGGSGGNGALSGYIYGEDMRTPVRNAVVKLRSLDSQIEYESEPTDLDGMYKIPGIEEGRYVMGVVSFQGDYNFHYSILIKSDALAKLSVAMKPGAAPVRLEEGTGSTAKKGLGQFFKSPAGILTLITIAEVTVFALVLSEGEASPIR